MTEEQWVYFFLLSPIVILVSCIAFIDLHYAGALMVGFLILVVCSSGAKKAQKKYDHPSDEQKDREDLEASIDK
jgi:hypothetical protein